jgi:hypothetical protein
MLQSFHAVPALFAEKGYVMLGNRVKIDTWLDALRDRKQVLVSIIIACTVLAGLLVACMPPPTAVPIETDQPTVTPTPTSETPEPIKLPGPSWQECEFLVSSSVNYRSEAEVIAVWDVEYGPDSVQFVDGQVLVAGLPEDIELVIKAANDELGLDQEQGLYWEDERDQLAQLPNGFQTRRYRFPLESDYRAPDVVPTLRSIASDLAVLVFSDLNYVATAIQQGGNCGIEADPLSGEASPLSGEASPLSGEASPFNATPVPPPATVFWGQWALGESTGGGIGLVQQGQRDAKFLSGEGAQIILLDTSPFIQDGLAVFDGSDWIAPPFRLCVEHPLDVTSTLPADCDETLADQADHGLFAAGLAHAVAPEASLHLVRVLNDNGRGDLAGVIAVLSSLDPDRLGNTVLNMSLGFVPLPSQTEPLTRKQLCDRVEEEIGLSDCQNLLPELLDLFPSLSPELRLLVLDNMGAATLELAVVEVLRSGAVLAAAAGNNSSASNVLEPELPAALGDVYPGILAVAATTSGRERAFYSNRGRVAAPGGGDNTLGCEQVTEECWGRTEHWLMSAAVHQDECSNEYYSYGYWVGTSFATPLVSGLAALNLAGGTGAPDAMEDVAAAVCPAVGNNQDALGAGIAHIDGLSCP